MIGNRTGKAKNWGLGVWIQTCLWVMSCVADFPPIDFFLFSRFCDKANNLFFLLVLYLFFYFS